jgi:hypothetical protein
MDPTVRDFERSLWLNGRAYDAAWRCAAFIGALGKVRP